MGGDTNTPDTDLPAGAVASFNLSSCPEGWEPFSAAQARFIVGSDSGSTYSNGDTGGSSSQTLTTLHLPAHTHTIDPPVASVPSVDGSHTHTTSDYLTSIGGSNQYILSSGSRNRNATQTKTTTSNTHAHTLDIASFSSSSAGGATAIDFRPPYISLLYCEKL